MALFPKRLQNLFTRVRYGAIELTNKRYEKITGQVLEIGQDIQELSNEELKHRSAVLKQQIATSQPDRKPAEFFALVREVAYRTVAMRPYEVQLVAGLALNQGRMVEMQTGEGKTLAAVAPVCWHAIAGRGAHVLTFNDYLAKRDAQWMGPIYEFLGFRVGYVTQGMPAEQRQAAYDCDITYVTAKEVGFDYLRDQLCTDVADQVQRGFYFAIVDEADSMLIDEARIPLVIAGEDHEENEDLPRYAELIRQMNSRSHFSIQPGMRNVSFREAGINWLQKTLRCGVLHEESNVDLLTRLNLALQAEKLLKRDVDYIVREGRVELIDEFTGRVAENRRWPYGLQAAIEAKEKLAIQPQGRILKTITLQHFLEQYQVLSGMTGTAQSAATEVNDFYGLKTVVIPPNRPCIRIDQDDVVFANKRDKYARLVAEIARQHATGRPILVGTSSVEESQLLADLLRPANIRSNVLNAKNDQAEAEIVADAGALSAVTISTNMAGRGTDIQLGGHEGNDRDRVVELGGLYVIGTNRHESRRIDDQLRGRAGRQGDPGESRFFVSGEDDLLSRCEVGQLDIDMTQFESGKPLADPRVGKRIARIQRFIESESSEIRRTLRNYSTCTEQHRKLMQRQRQQILDGSAPTSLLAQANQSLYDTLVQRYGQQLVHDAERTVAVHHIDDCWADHLQVCSEVRNGIYLASMGGLNALDEFNKQVNASFRGYNDQVSEKVANSFRQVRISGDEIDMDQEGLVGPSSTWTYMINDNPMGEVIDRLTRGIKRAVRRTMTDY
jgi:preprotein translocase subunit SecA